MADVERTPVEDSPPSSVTSILDGGDAPSSKEVPAWQEQLPQELRGNEAFDGIENVHDLARKNLELTRSSGQSGDLGRIPSADSTAEENNDFWKRIGRPDAPSDYEFGNEDVAENFLPDEQSMIKLKELMFKAGVTKQAAKDFVKDLSTDAVAALESVQKKAEEERQEALTHLREREWRGEYDQNINLARKGWNWLMEQDLRDKVVNSGLSEDPGWLKAMHRLGRQLGEETITVGTPPPPPQEAPKEYPNSPEMYGEGRNSTIYQPQGQPVRRFAGTANSAQGVEARNPNAGRTPSGRRPR